MSQFQGFGGLVHPTRLIPFLTLAWPVCAQIQSIAICICFEFEEKKAPFIFPTTKGSMNACMEHVGFRTSKKVKNHWVVALHETFTSMIARLNRR